MNSSKRRMGLKYGPWDSLEVPRNGNVQVFSRPMSLPNDLLRDGPTRLRTLEPADVEWLMRWENAPEHWTVSGTTAPYSKAALEALCMGHQDVYTAGQLRWIVEERGKAVGAVDLYEFSALHRRSGIGILIAPEHRGQGTAGRALAIALRHAQDVLLLRSLHAQVHDDNGPSLHLFASAGFREVGRLRDWTQTRDGWRDAVVFQRSFTVPS